MTDYKLCYVYKGVAYFTSLPLSEQWGDDWDDAPYEHNSGEPYEDGLILKVHFPDEEFLEPSYGHVNSPYSVKDINNKKVPWLVHYSNETRIYAGESLKEFLQKTQGRILTQSFVNLCFDHNLGKWCVQRFDTDFCYNKFFTKEEALDYIREGGFSLVEVIE